MKNEILVVVKMPGEKAEKKLLNGNDMLKELQHLVGGYIEKLPYHDEDFSVLVNEEAAFNDMPANCRIDEYMVLGPVVVIKTGLFDFESLSEKEAQKFVNQLNGSSNDKAVCKKLEKMQEDFVELATSNNISFCSFLYEPENAGGRMLGTSLMSIPEQVNTAARIIEKAAVNMAHSKDVEAHSKGFPEKLKIELSIKAILSTIDENLTKKKGGEQHD